MASSAAALMTAAARRLSRCTASAMVLREVSGSHKLTIDGCKPSKNLPKSWSWDSKAFPVGGHSWRIRYYPHGDPDDGNDGYISLYLELDPTSAIKEASGVDFKISLLDQSGNPVPEFTRSAATLYNFDWPSSYHGFPDFIKWEDLEESGCLKDDRFTIQCDVTFTTDLGSSSTTNDAAAPAPASVATVPPPPPSYKQEHLIDLLWKHKRGADVTIDVGGEATFEAHGWLLAARSPVLEAELLASKEKKSAGAAHRRIEIKDVEPKVFKAILHYMYTDALPEKMDDEGEEAMATAQGLLVAAHRFKLDRLKLMCEEMVSKRMDVGTAAGALAVAEQHGCGALKAACMDFMARPGNLKAVMETEGYEKAKALINHVVLMEVVVKQMADLMSGRK